MDKSEARILKKEEIEARLKSAKEAASPEDAASEALVDRYQEALDLLQSTTTQGALLETYRAALTSAPEAAAGIRRTLASTPPADSSIDDQPPAGLSKEADIDEINNRLNAARAAALEAKKKLESLKEDLAVQQTRPAAIRDRVITIQQGILAAEAESAELKSKADATELDQAALVQALIQVEALKAELAALEQEQLSYDERVALAEAQRDLASRLAANAEAEATAIQRFADQRLKVAVNQAAMVAEQTLTDTEDRPEVVRGVAAEIGELARKSEEVGRKIAKVSGAAENVEARLGDLQEQFDELKAQIGIGGQREAHGEILLEQRRLMPDVRAIHSDMSRSDAAIIATRLALYQTKRTLRDSPETVAADLLDESKTSLTGAARERQLAELVALIEKRNELLEALSAQYRRLLTEEGSYDMALRQLAELTTESEAFLNEKLLWVRSSEPISLSTFTELPAGIAWLFGADHAGELKVALMGLWDRAPALIILTGTVFLFLILTRSRCKKRITDLGRRVRKVSTDRYQFTLEAFLLTIVLAVPYPLLPAFLGWRLLETPYASDWLQGLAAGLLYSGYLLFVVFFIRAICREGGVAEQHFRWRRQPLVSLRENVTRISILYIPAAIIVSITLNEKGVTHLASIGRLTLILVMLWLAYFLRRLLDKQTGVLSLMIHDHPEGLLARLHTFWTFLFLSLPLTLMVLALAGYTLTAFSLIRQFRLTLEIIGIGVVAYALILRWFSMRERRLIVEQAIRERRERAAAAAKEAERVGSDSTDEGVLPEFDEGTIDFEEVGDQTRRLLRFVVCAVVAVAIWFGWADILPALRGLDAIKIVGDISLGALIPAIFILIVTTMVAQNLPGLLEIGVLSHLPLDSGLRYTLISLCQYAVVAVGLFLAIGVLGIEWSSFGWIVAALSVGLGFGLQEIVSNFISGIILLFERPIRVGDVVTVSGTTGVVSKIRIRATTIINYDRQEFIVPNKEFITGNLLNWTLSTTLNRVVFVVGVAYGSDTRRARNLLLEICHNHPEVLEEPPSRADFDEFGNSTLNFTVRTYLASMDNRLDVINELHHQIHERFAAEGIEIAFPQLDLHLRSVDAGVNFNGGQTLKGA